jgi:4-hydroxy-3-methylbut-2-enyl diphosphate reductase
MIIEVDSNSGFCFGVVEAVRKAEETLQHQKMLYCLGDIVHNDSEVKRLAQKGLITINYEQYFAMNNVTVLLRAHGEPPSTYEYARQNNIRLIDATCPVVLKLQQRIHTVYKSDKSQKTQLVIFGKKGHAEVNGLVGQTDGTAIVIEDPSQLDNIDFNQPIELYSQTTKDLEGFNRLAAEMKQRTLDAPVKIHDTVCRQVANRIPAIRKFSVRFELIIFVSGLKSSNGKMLYDICRSVNPNTKFISSIEEIDKLWFNGIVSVGICGATSTPKNLLDDVAAAIGRLKI